MNEFFLSLILYIYELGEPIEAIISNTVSYYYLTAFLVIVSAIHLYSNMTDTKMWQYNKIKVFLSFYYLLVSLLIFGGIYHLAILSLILGICFKMLLDIESTSRKRKDNNCMKICKKARREHD